MSKECSSCGCFKDFHEYLDHTTSSDGLGYFCVECRTVKARLYKATGSTVGTSYSGKSIKKLMSMKKEIEMELRMRNQDV